MSDIKKMELCKNQLLSLIEEYPNELEKYNIYIDIFGVLLDYISRTNSNIETILSGHNKLYKGLFNGDNTDKTKQFLKVILFDPKKRQSARNVAKQESWSEFIKIIDEIEDEIYQLNFIRTSSQADILAGHRVDGIVWQLSDIHFGKCNEIDLDPVALADTLILIVRETPEFEPNLIVISGDISSTAAKEEFDDFFQFIKHLSEGIWGEYRAHRILVVPGNHEISWLDGGKADKLSNFYKYVADTQKVITPFWRGPKSISDSDGEITIQTYFNKEDPDTPPFAVVCDKNINLQLILLISSYFSGSVPISIIECFEKINSVPTKETILNLLREDKGEITREALVFLKKMLRKDDAKTTFGVIHHHMNQYNTKACETPYARNLLSTLAEKGCRLLLHGHTHLVEGTGSPRTPNPNEAYPIPCPTLCSDIEPGSTWGFMVHMLSPHEEPRAVTTTVWNFDEHKFFQLNNNSLNIRYKFKIAPDKIELL